MINYSQEDYLDKISSTRTIIDSLLFNDEYFL